MSADKERYMPYATAVKINSFNFRIVDSSSSKWGVGYEYDAHTLNPTALLTDHGLFEDFMDV